MRWGSQKTVRVGIVDEMNKIVPAGGRMWSKAMPNPSIQQTENFKLFIY